ncbi:Cob(III)alamin reductase @ Cob(II)alamin reductase [Escherichia coli ISC7]|uniref:Cob(III)alamin reductase @ Cob(II)alamin reductase n=16 Tax=Escherichia TaxID=561 RepID=W1F7F3_ECOLX|nr:Cob(III)alamin reductase @ Cob(II)alamin reductase [Escherichia coli ISC7]
MNVKLTSCDDQTIRERVQAAGVVGAGGAGFPTHIKLQARVDTFLVNAAECEPMLKVDQQLMAQQASRLLRGVHYAMKATGASSGIIALKEKYQRAINALTPLLPPDIRLHILPDVYPAGDEVLTIWMATGRRVPPAALPVSVGVVVNNVQTVLNITRAVEQQYPVTRRTLTVNGAVAKPITVTVPIGMSLREVLALAGGATVDAPGFINGGPMMGSLITSLDTPVSKTTGGLLVLPNSHSLIQRRLQNDRSVLAVAKTVCEQCRLCTDLCPRHLIGHELAPHLLVRAVNYQQLATPQLLLTALTCSECNVCASVACPVGISPMRINRLLKQELRAQNLRYEGALNPADPMANYRLIPVKRLVTRLGLTPWYQDAPLSEQVPQPEKVTLLLRQHIGASAIACVQKGDRVVHGQCVGQIPHGTLGAPIHASIDGMVSDVTEKRDYACERLTMSKAVGILELSSIAKGMETGDAMLKSANVELLVSKTLCPGKFLLMLGGDVGAAQQAINSGASLAGEMLVDSLVLPNIHPSLLSAISGLNHVEQHRAVGVVETWSVAACIDAADCAVKAANVILVRVHMAFGIGGKCYMVVAGDISDVNNAVSVASERAGEKGLLVYRSVIARPHEAMWRQMVEG